MSYRKTPKLKHKFAIDQKTVAKVRECTSQPKATITQRIRELGREWGTERVLEANASTLALIGLLLSIFVNQNWFWLIDRSAQVGIVSQAVKA